MRPNILCIVSEDCPTRLGAYGDPVARTPNLDALAARGVTFDAATVTAPVCSPSRFSILTGRHAESVPPAHQMRALGPMPEGVVTYPEMMRAAGYYCTNNAKTDYNVDIDPIAPWDDNSGTAHWMNRADGQPFLAVFNCMLTHESCVFQTIDGAVRPEDVTLPAYLPDLPELRRDLATYYNRIEQMDAWMGDRLAELDAAGLTEDTIVIYYSDHASPLARSKRFCYDDGSRIPLIVAVPDKWRHLLPDAPGSRNPTPVSMIDLLQTFAAVAGIDPPAGVQGVPFLGPDRLTRSYTVTGRDRMDARYDLTRSLRGERFRYIRNYTPHRPWGQYYSYAWQAKGYQAYEAAHLAGTLTPLQERFWQHKPAEELYDNWQDPDSTRDLATDPAHADTLADMRAALDAHMLAIHDCGFIPEGSPIEAEAMRNNPAIYPIRDVLALANTAIRRDATSLPAFVAGLGHASPIMRYWAAQGLLILSVEGQAMPDALQSALETETDPDVRIVLLEAMGHAGDAETAVRALTDLAHESQPTWTRVKAMAAMTELPLMPEISREVVAKAASEPGQYIRGAAGYLIHLLDGTYTPETLIFDTSSFLRNVGGHTGMGPQSFPDLESLRTGAA